MCSHFKREFWKIIIHIYYFQKLKGWNNRVTIWIGPIGITVHSGKENYIKKLRMRFSDYVDDSQGQIDLEIVETNYKPEITKTSDEYFWFTMFSGNVYVYIEYSNWSGKAFICEDTPVRYDAIESMLTMIAAQFSGMFGSILVHGCCIDYHGTGLCFMGDSGVGKSTVTKMLSSEYSIIAEDMFIMACYEDKIIAYSIPFGQKHFWVENGRKITLNAICFLQNGELGFEIEDNRKRILENLLHNQFYKARKNEVLLMDAMRFNINRICNNASLYNFSWSAERFYAKDRVYMKDTKKRIDDLVLLSAEKKKAKSYSDGKYSLNKYIHIREDYSRNRLELWDASIHRLYGITGLGVLVLHYAQVTQSFTITELKKYLKGKITFDYSDLMNQLNELLDKKIIEGEYIIDEQVLYDK